MKKVLLIIALIWANALTAQIQLNGIHNNIFASGDTIGVTGIDRKNLINVPLKGDDMTWDYSSLNNDIQFVIRSFVPDVNTVGFSTYPSANYVAEGMVYDAEKDSFIVQEEYLFLKKDMNNVVHKLGGYNVVDQSVNENCTYTITATFPFKKGDQYKEEGYCHETDNINDRNRTISTLTYEGFGKVKFPGENTYTDVAWAKLVSVNYDSINNIYNTYVDSSIYLSNTDNSKILTFDYSHSRITTYLADQTVISRTFERDTSYSYLRKTNLTEIKVNGLDEDELAQFFSIYPNPAKDKIALKNADQIASFELYDISGKLLKGYSDVNKIELDVPVGLYLAKITDKIGRVIYTKLTKE